ncbi:MAG TPA: MFS transporter [Rubrivivax sp.]
MTPDSTLKSLFAQREYMRLWWVRVAGTSASQMLMVAIGWHMYDLTGSAWDLGLVGLLQFLPALGLALVAGHVVDRYHRARIISACLAVQAVVAALLMATPVDGVSERTLLLGLSVVLGAVRAFQMPAQQALVPLLVPPALLPRAMAFSSAGLQASIIAGPALGGFIYVAGSVVVYGSCAVLFAAAALLCATIRHASPPAGAGMSLDTLLAGVRYVQKNKVVLGAISLDLFAVLFGGAIALLPMFAKDILHVGPWGLGLLRGAPALGALALSVVLTRWPIVRGAGLKLFSAIAVYGLATLVFGLSTSFLLSMVALFVTGAADMVSVVVRQTMVQLETPDEMRGRVSAVNSVFIGASNQLGEFESGATAAWLGPVGSVVLGGLGTLVVAALWWRWFPTLARRDHLVLPKG